MDKVGAVMMDAIYFPANKGEPPHVNINGAAFGYDPECEDEELEAYRHDVTAEYYPFDPEDRTQRFAVVRGWDARKCYIKMLELKDQFLSEAREHGVEYILVRGA